MLTYLLEIPICLAAEPAVMLFPVFLQFVSIRERGLAVFAEMFVLEVLFEQFLLIEHQWTVCTVEVAGLHVLLETRYRVEVLPAVMTRVKLDPVVDVLGLGTEVHLAVSAEVMLLSDMGVQDLEGLLALGTEMLPANVGGEVLAQDEVPVAVRALEMFLPDVLELVGEHLHAKWTPVYGIDVGVQVHGHLLATVLAVPGGALVLTGLGPVRQQMTPVTEDALTFKDCGTPVAVRHGRPMIRNSS